VLKAKKSLANGEKKDLKFLAREGGELKELKIFLSFVSGLGTTI
jgi:hypothetical protein